MISKSLRHELIPRLALDTLESANRDRRSRYTSYLTESYDPNTAKELISSAKTKIEDLKKNNEESANFILNS